MRGRQAELGGEQRFAKATEAGSSDAGQEIGPVLEVAIGRGRGDAGAASHLAQADIGLATGHERIHGGLDQGFPQVAVMVGLATRSR